LNPSAIESHLVLVLIAWAVIVMLSWAMGRLGRRLGQPLAVGEIAAGVMLGPSVLGCCGAWGASAVAFLRDASLQQSLQLLGKLGLILLLFQVGMEFQYSHIRSRSRTVLLTAGLGIIGPMLLGWLIAPWLHRNFAPDVPRTGMMLFCGIAMSISALPIMGRILIERGWQDRPFAVLAITAAAMDDVVGWVLLALAGALTTAWAKHQEFDPLQLCGQIFGIVLLIALLLKVVGPSLIRWYRTIATDEDDLPHSFLAVLLVVLFLTSIATHQLGIFTIFGAFLLGVSLHQERRLVEAWKRRFSAFVMVALVPIFFTNNGLNVNLQSLSSFAWVGLAVVCGCSILGKLGCCYLGARWGGESRTDAFRIATLLNTRALMGLIAVSVGKNLGLLNDTLFTMFVLMCLLTTAMCGPLLQATMRGKTIDS
jgi:Kef-type K+ transport system membrane component KefB